MDSPRSADAIATWDQPAWSIDELVAAKNGRTLSVVLPALNEEKTVATVVKSIRGLLGTLVDELIVLDSGCTDRTAKRATKAGARVVTREEAVPDIAPVPGKGEVLWRSLAATTGDLIAFVDSDLINPDPAFVPNLVGPLLMEDGIHLVKGYYQRPLKQSGKTEHHGGGRVTELVARPLLAALRPELCDVIQPLGGEYAGTRELLESVPFAPGYGVEIGLLLDTHERFGSKAIAQVNLGTRSHRNRSLADLGKMSRQIVGATLRRCGSTDSGAALTQFPLIDGVFTATHTEVSLEDRPPMQRIHG